MQLSIIIPCLNEEKTLSKLLPYLISNCPKNNVEIIVVDGQSADKTVTLAKTYTKHVLISTKSGRAPQMNLGAQHATADVLYFVHADVVPPISFYNDIAQAIDQQYSLGLYRQKFDSAHPLLYINSFFSRFPKLWCRGGDQTLFIKKTVFNHYGCFDESYVVMEEYDLLQKVWDKEKIKFFDSYTTVSARKYSTNSWLRVQWANYTAFSMFKKGLPSTKIKEKYFTILNPFNNY